MSTNPPDQPEPEHPQAPDPGQQPQDQPPPQYQQPPQYAAAQPYPAARPMGGYIWLGVAIAVVAPVVAFWIGMSIDSAANARGDYSSMATLTMALIGIVGVFVAAIVLTIIPKTRRTGIGMWIGIAALPIIAFGVCTALVFGAGG